MNDPRLSAAAAILGRALAGISTINDEVGADFTFEPQDGRVWANITLPSGDVYELSARWVSEASP